ncbi:MAG: hypothetical protein MUC43_06700 [Pirellula sp.]|nr:hypothetical protein [Pirellula sp.]
MKRSITHLLTLVVSVASATAGFSQEPQPSKTETKQVTTKAKKNKEKNVRTVEMFQAMDEGLVSVEYIGRSQHHLQEQNR